MEGPGQFEVSFVAGPGDHRRLDVLTHRPLRFGRDARILFVMHGTKRNAIDYRDTWADAADRYGCLIVCPRFSLAEFPRGAYQLGGLRDGGGHRPDAAWTFQVIERLFDLIRDAADNASAGYHLYGHSAGGQFVHRLVLLLPNARHIAAISANAGWYTMPTFDERYPYGLAGTGRGPDDLSRALGRTLTVLLGAADTDPDDPHLRTSKRAMRQGHTRLERGLAFHAAARAAAIRLGTELAWTVTTVPGVGHSDPEMMPTAAQLLFADGESRRGR